MRTRIKGKTYNTETALLAWDLVNVPGKRIMQIYHKRTNEFFLYEKMFFRDGVTRECIQPMTCEEVRAVLDEF